MTTMTLREMDDQVTYVQQLQDDDGQVVLINQFSLAPDDAGRFLEVWAGDAAFMKQQPGFISAQLHRGTVGGRYATTSPGRPMPRPSPLPCRPGRW
jgi:hypothetical protein